MARAALILLLAYAAAGAALATPDYSALPYDEAPQEGFEEKQVPAEEERAGQEEEWQAHDASQEENLEKTAAEQQTQQVQDRQVSVDVDEGTARRIREEIQGDQQRQGNQQWPGNQWQGNQQWSGNQQSQENQQWPRNQQSPGNQQSQGNQQWPRNQQGQGNQQWQDNQQRQRNQQWQGSQQWQQRQGQLQGQGQERGRQDGPWGAVTPRPNNNDFGIVGPGGSRPLDRNPPPPWVPGSNRGVSGQQPPSDYRRIKEFGHFKVFTTPRTWPEAQMMCLAEGANLAVPSSEAEARAIAELFGQVKVQVRNAQDNNLFFIAASDLHKEGSFSTPFGTKFIPNGVQSYKWQRGEPNNRRKSEHCVLSNDKGLFWKGNCLSKYAFVCRHNQMCLTFGASGQLVLQQQTRF